MRAAGGGQPPRRRHRNAKNRTDSASSSARKVFSPREPLLALIDALGLNEQLLHADPRAPRYILFGGRLVPAPLAPPSLLTTPLLSAGTKWRLFTEMLRHTHPPAGDESIAAFVRRKFGDELLNRLVAPFRLRRLCRRSGKIEPARRVSEAPRI